MDNKTKIVASFLIVFFLSSCMGWIENHTLYERTLNEWASIEYSIERRIYLTDYLHFTFSNNLEKEIGTRLEVHDYNSHFAKESIIKDCFKINYNNDFILAKGKYYDKDSSYTSTDGYYKVAPTFATDGVTPNGYTVDTLTLSKYQTLINNCKNCEELDANKIRELDTQLEEKEMTPYKVKFVFIIILIVIFKVYTIKNKRRRKSKPNTK